MTENETVKEVKEKKHGLKEMVAGVWEQELNEPGTKRITTEGGTKEHQRLRKQW